MLPARYAKTEQQSNIVTLIQLEPVVEPAPVKNNPGDGAKPEGSKQDDVKEIKFGESSEPEMVSEQVVSGG